MKRHFDGERCLLIRRGKKANSYVRNADIVREDNILIDIAMSEFSPVLKLAICIINFLK